MRRLCSVLIIAGVVSGGALAYDFSNLPDVAIPKIEAQNALWVENPVEKQFLSSKQIVVADIEGPGRIEMVHFAMPGTLKLGRECLLRMYWDGETEPSVDVPLVDFFACPDGQFDSVDTALVNVRRGFNTYFPMPFRKSARIEVVYDGDLEPGHELQSKMPCYSYVMYRKLDSVPENEGYLHANWRQETLPMGSKAYTALEAQGKGKFVGWSVTVRKPGAPAYMVDMNEIFYVDGEETASVEFQGIEDSFGFSWGFPESESEFPLTGYRKYYKGAAAYRFFIDDAIPFTKSLRVDINFGPQENEVVKAMVGEEGYWHEFSSVCYWYQTEPHAPLPQVPGIAERQPAPDDNPAWPHQEELPTEQDLSARNVELHIRCGREQGEVIHATDGFDLASVDGFSWNGWPVKIYHARANNETLTVTLDVPKRAEGVLRLYMADPDRFVGGRVQQVFVEGQDQGVVKEFFKGTWMEVPVDASQTADGKVDIAVKNLNPNPPSNAVLSIIEWVATARR